MRFVPAYCLREGMVLGQPLYGRNNELLLAKGIVLNNNFIESIHRLNINGIYVDDDISKDIEIANVISDSIKRKTIKSIKDIFIVGEEKPQITQIRLRNIKMQIENIIDEILYNDNLMINMIDLKVFDDYTYYHSLNVAIISIILGVALGFNRNELYNLGLGALLHDIGKVFIPKEILNKKGKLTDEEYEIVKKHPELGYEYVREKFEIPATSRIVILQHHERYDGTGYPYSKKSREVHKFSRIVAIADVYDALTSDRPYRKAMFPSEVMEYMMGGASALFDPEFIKIFIRKVAPYPVGTCVNLSNGTTAIVVENYEDCCLRPKVRIFKEGNLLLVNPYEISLRDNPKYLSTTITGIADM